VTDERPVSGEEVTDSAQESATDAPPAAGAPEGGDQATVSVEESGAEAPPAGDDRPEPDLQTKIDELTADLQRLQAEYVNYKRRVERDRELVSQNATYKVLAPIVDVLDTIDRAREHGEVEGGFKAVADQLERIVTNLGLTKFGEPGEPFDPTVHEALSHMGTDAGVKETTVKVLAKAGYRIGDRVVRAAQVLVVDPE